MTKFLFSFAVLTALCFSQTGPGGSNYNKGGGVTITTVSGLNSISGKTKGTLATVTDGTSSSDCTTGGSSTPAVCLYTGSAWTASFGGAGGTGTVTHTIGSLTANAMLSGNGLADIKVADANGVTYSMGAITTDINPFALTWTTNNAATTFSGMKFIVTNTAFHSGSLNFQWCNGASGALCASIDTAANFLTVGNGTFGAGNTVAGIVAEGGGTQAPIATNSFTISTQGSSVMTGWNANFPAAAGNGVINWTNTSNQVNGAFITSAANGDLLSGTGTAWTKFAGNASGTKILQEDASGNLSWVAAPTGGVSLTTTTVSGLVIPEGIPGTATTGNFTGANVTQAAQFVLHETVLITKISGFVGTGNTTATCDWGIYTLAGALQAHTGSQGCGSGVTGTVITAAALPSAITLSPGVYFTAACSSVGAVTIGVIAFANEGYALIATGTNNAGVAGTAGACTAGVLPNTLGTVTNNAAIAVPAIGLIP